MIEIEHLSKRFGITLAVEDLTFTVRPGRVTGFLGPNGAGKSTTLRMIMGLARPSTGRVRVNGRSYADHAAPLREMGALLDARAVHPGRTAYDHLRIPAAIAGISTDRVRKLLDLVGLSRVADRRTRTFSLGMTQRLGVATALLGDPRVIVLDEPVNGLDPDGIRWIRRLLRDLAAEGRTVFLSSHLMSEMALTADHLVVLGRGRLLADVSMSELLGTTAPTVRVRTPQAEALLDPLLARRVQVQRPEPTVLLIEGQTVEQVADLAFAHHVVLHELTAHQRSLEDAYLDLTHGATSLTTSDPATTTHRRAA